MNQRMKEWGEWTWPCLINYGWSRKGDSLRTTSSIPEKEVRPKRSFGLPKTKCLSFILPISIALKWHILKFSPLFEKQHIRPWFEPNITKTRDQSSTFQFSIMSKCHISIFKLSKIQIARSHNPAFKKCIIPLFVFSHIFKN